MNGGGGAATIDGQIDCSVLVRSSPEAVWDAVATPAGLDGWFTSGAEVDARPGGRILFRWKAWGPDAYTGEDGGPVLEARRPSLLVFQWRPDGPSYATTVRIEIAPAPGGTLVRLREYGFRDTPSGRRAMLSCASGWGEALALWKMYVEHGVRY